MTDSTDNARGPERIWWNAAPMPHSYTSTVQFAGGTEYIRADLAPDPLGAVKVKQLEWREVETYGGQCFDAIALHTVYRIIPKHDGRYWLTEPDCSLPTLEAAKAAAQSDYKTCIRSALEPCDPLADPRVVALVSAAGELSSIIEGIQGAFNHGTWRDEKNGMRLKDTNEWVTFYVALAALSPTGGNADEHD